MGVRGLNSYMSRINPAFRERTVEGEMQWTTELNGGG